MNPTSKRPRARYRIGVDVGGTHTDMVLADIETGSFRIEKLPSTPVNPARAVTEGLGRFIAAGVAPREIDFFSHGTTVTTNALLEMNGAQIGLLVNAGMGGIFEVQTQGRDGVSPFDHFFKKPAPLVRPRFMREIAGRLDYRGHEIAPLDEAAVVRAARELAAAGATSFCICLLFSFVNNAHEERAAGLVREAAPGAFVSVSSAVLPRIREWPRFSTALLNAYLTPVLAHYCRDLATSLDRCGVTTRRRFLMQSNGGVMPLLADPEIHTVRTLLSGPAAGVRGAAFLLGERLGLADIVTMDMGGTSCDIAFVENGEALEQTDGSVAQRLVGVPALDVVTIPAGGGSLACVNAAGMLDVGPQSAGAAPGPACYGRGGTRATVTDADLVCGALNADYFLGGEARLDRDAAVAAIAATVAEPMGSDVATAASGIVRLVDARITDAIRVEAAKRGIDLTGFTLVPFGGAGPVHAAQVAQDLAIKRVLVPRHPGAFSALGLLCTDILHDHMRSELADIATLDPQHCEDCFAGLRRRAYAECEAEGLDPAQAIFSREIDMRYAGQGYELRVALDFLPGPLDADALVRIGERFHTQHAAQHGHCAPQAAVEVVSYRLRACVPMPKYAPSRGAPLDNDRHSPRPLGSRRLVVGAGKSVTAIIWRRDDLTAGWMTAGPAIIEQIDATTVVPPGWTASCDPYDNLILERGG